MMTSQTLVAEDDATREDRGSALLTGEGRPSNDCPAESTDEACALGHASRFLAEGFEFTVGYSVFSVWFATTWQERIEWLSGEIKVAHVDRSRVEKNTPIVWLEKRQDPSYRKTLLIAPVAAEVRATTKRGVTHYWTLKPTEAASVSRWFGAYGQDCGSALLDLMRALCDAAEGPLRTWQPELGRWLCAR